ncbi:MAG: hypothetical protein NTY46_05590 [Candidatus Sumerlaeota bacterium]|nr:hypothetical protein [Candidatus Sumerlaeota bacterium]
MRILNTICSAIRNKLRLFFHTQKTDSGCDVIAIFLAIITLAYPILFAFQGFDLMDMGFNLSGFSCFFQERDYVAGTLYLTVFIGACIDWLFHPFGAVAFKLACSFAWDLCAILAWLILRRWHTNRHTWLALLVTTATVTNYLTTWLDYNVVTVTLYMIAVWCVIESFRRGAHMLFLCGFVLGLNVFSRVSNLTGLGMCAVLVLDFFEPSLSWRMVAKRWMAMIAGIAAGLAGGFGLIAALGHWEAFWFNVGLLEKSTSHTPDLMKNLFVWGNIRAFEGGILRTAEVGAALAIMSVLTCRLNRLPTWAAAGLGTVFGLLVNWIQGKYYPGYLATGSEHNLLAERIVGVLYCAHGILLFCIRKDSLYRYAVACSLLVLIVTPVGSNNGLFNSVYGFWLGLALPLAAMIEAREVRIGNSIVVNRFVWLLFTAFIVTGLLVSNFRHDLVLSYRDAPRSVAWGTVDHPKLRFLWMGEEHAKPLGQLLKEVRKYVRPGDYVLAYNEIPVFYYLTDTIPYMYLSNPRYSPEETIQRMLAKAERNRAGNPVVVRRPLNEAQRKIHKPIEDFIAARGYEVKWKNGDFEILTTSGTQTTR